MILRSLLLTSALLLLVHASELFAKEHAFDAQGALVSLYGGVLWSNPKLAEYFEGQSQGYVTVAFESSYTERHEDKRVVIVHITPRPMEEYGCHACIPLIGGGVFARTGDSWNLESKSEIIGWGHSFGEQFNLVKIGTDKYGISHSVSDANQGYQWETVDLIVPFAGVLNVSLAIGFPENPGPGACKNAPKQHVDMQFVPRPDTEYFDVVTDIQKNEGSCKTFMTRRESARYRFVDGKYQRVAHP